MMVGDFERRGVAPCNLVDVRYEADYLARLRFADRVKAACVGGRSSIRRGDRAALLAVDQWVGLVCNLAVCEFLAGSPAPWALLRDRADANRYAGDGGEDFPGLAVDIKGASLRGNPDPLRYRLAVRPRERRAGWTYFLAIARSTGEGVPTGGAFVTIVGAAKDGDLPTACELAGPFAGAFTIPAVDLRPVDGCRLCLRAFWEGYKQRKGIA